MNATTNIQRSSIHQSVSDTEGVINLWKDTSAHVSGQVADIPSVNPKKTSSKIFEDLLTQDAHAEILRGAIPDLTEVCEELYKSFFVSSYPFHSLAIYSGISKPVLFKGKCCEAIHGKSQDQSCSGQKFIYEGCTNSLDTGSLQLNPWASPGRMRI